MTMRRNPWGRMVSDDNSTTAPVTVETLESMVREVGLNETAAGTAARGLHNGTYLSFADAAHSQTLWNRAPKLSEASEARVTEAAARLDGANVEPQPAYAWGSTVRQQLSEAVRDAYPGRYGGGSIAYVFEHDETMRTVDFFVSGSPHGASYEQSYDVDEQGRVRLTGMRHDYLSRRTKTSRPAAVTSSSRRRAVNE